MARPKKCRKVCCMPAFEEFVPVASHGCFQRSCGSDKDQCVPECAEPHNQRSPVSAHTDTVVMTVDEYETIRLIDLEGLSQEECCLRMDVARTTVQQIYNDARKKIAEAIVNGLNLKIEGGRYELCDGKNHFCGCGGCMRRKGQCRKNGERSDK